jgi:transposase
MSKFDYQTASVRAIAAHLNEVHQQTYYQLIKHYTKKGNNAMLSKLEQSKKLAKIFKLQVEYVQQYGVDQ